MPEKFNPDAFTTFLGTVNAATQVPSSEPSSLVLLRTLAGANVARMEVSSLLVQTGLPIDILAASLKQLETQGLVTRTMSDGREIVELTRLGRELAA